MQSYLPPSHRLSPHFTVGEFTRSQTAARLGMPVQVTADSVVHRNLVRLCEQLLEPLRVLLGQPIHITSGYRPDWLNRAVGGSANSLHRDGRAADIVVGGIAPLQVCLLAQTAELPFDQLIHEFGEWTHIGIPREDAPPRRQTLTATSIDGSTLYRNWLLPVVADVAESAS